jgi:hypothetical protein
VLGTREFHGAEPSSNLDGLAHGRARQRVSVVTRVVTAVGPEEGFVEVVVCGVR